MTTVKTFISQAYAAPNWNSYAWCWGGERNDKGVTRSSFHPGNYNQHFEGLHWIISHLYLFCKIVILLNDSSWCLPSIRVSGLLQKTVTSPVESDKGLTHVDWYWNAIIFPAQFGTAFFPPAFIPLCHPCNKLNPTNCLIYPSIYMPVHWELSVTFGFIWQTCIEFHAHKWWQNGITHYICPNLKAIPNWIYIILHYT